MYLLPLQILLMPLVSLLEEPIICKVIYKKLVVFWYQWLVSYLHIEKPADLSNGKTMTSQLPKELLGVTPDLRSRSRVHYLLDSIPRFPIFNKPLEKSHVLRLLPFAQVFLLTIIVVRYILLLVRLLILAGRVRALFLAIVDDLSGRNLLLLSSRHYLSEMASLKEYGCFL